MKKAIFLMAFIATSRLCFAQQIPADTTDLMMKKEEYLQKVRNKKSGAIALIVVGGVLEIIAVAVAAGDAKNSLDGIFEPGDRAEDHETLTNVLAGTGLAFMLGSIPLFISSHKYKKRAMSIGFKYEQATQVQQSMVFYRSIPSVSLKISL